MPLHVSVYNHHQGAHSVCFAKAERVTNQNYIHDEVKILDSGNA